MIGHETSTTIAIWADKTFGPSSLECTVARANLEMAELVTKVANPVASYDEIAEEIADVVICLARCSSQCGKELWEEVTRKMEINRARKWKLNGDGTGQHEEPSDEG